MKRLRAFFESIVFADLKPGGRPGQPGAKGPGPVRRMVEKFLSGGSQKDPLYLTNRSLAQKAKAWAVIAIPCLLVIGFVALTLSRNYFDPPETAAEKTMTPEEISRKLLPNIAKDITIETNHDVEVVEVHVDHSAEIKLTGSVRNNSTHNITGADMVFNLTDSSGSQVGAVYGHIDSLAPKSTKAFQFPLKQENAAFALVREISASK